MQIMCPNMFYNMSYPLHWGAFMLFLFFSKCDFKLCVSSPASACLTGGGGAEQASVWPPEAHLPTMWPRGARPQTPARSPGPERPAGLQPDGAQQQQQHRRRQEEEEEEQEPGQCGQLTPTCSHTKWWAPISVTRYLDIDFRSKFQLLFKMECDGVWKVLISWCFIFICCFGVQDRVRLEGKRNLWAGWNRRAGGSFRLIWTVAHGANIVAVVFVSVYGEFCNCTS